MTGQQALQALDAAIVERERERWAMACRVRDEAAQVAREALARWSRLERERRINFEARRINGELMAN
jgi:hypothetical protein